MDLSDLFETVQKLQGSQARLRFVLGFKSLRPYRNYKVLKQEFYDLYVARGFETVQKLQGSQANRLDATVAKMFETVQKLQGSQASIIAFIVLSRFETVQKLQGSQAETRVGVRL